MPKALGYVLVVFLSLVALDWLFTSASSLLPSSPNFGPISGASGERLINSTSGSSGVVLLHFDLFTPSGVGTSYMTQGYGRTPYAYLYINGWHNGIDIGASFGTPVYSPASGVVLATVNQDSYCPHIAFGKYAAVEDPTNHLVLVYSHLGTFDVSPGEQINKGTLIGTIGPTGLETGPHLLISIFEEQGFSTTPAHGCGPYPQGQDVNPLNYLGSLYD